MPEIVIGRSDDDLEKYGTIGTIALGKNIVGTGEDTHLTTPILLDVIRPHLILISGKRGYGKSYDMGVMIEEMLKLPDNIRNNLCSIVIDTQGIFWTMKSPDERALSLLNSWGLKPSGFNVQVYVPEGQSDVFAESGVEFDGTFSFHPNDLTVDEWLAVFSLSSFDALGAFLQSILSRMKYIPSIDEIIKEIEKKEGFEKEKIVLKNYFEAAKSWGIFGESKVPSLMEGSKISIIDVSLTPDNVRALLVSLIGKKIFIERTKARRIEEYSEIEMLRFKKSPMPWFYIDEAHNFLPNDGKTAATDILNKIVKEGRQPGISLVFVTQRPEKLNQDALAQSDLIIAHRLTAKTDIDALRSIMQTYMLYDIASYINELPHLKGAAIVLDDNSERIYKVMIRPRQSWHAGASPTAL